MYELVKGHQIIRLQMSRVIETKNAIATGNSLLVKGVHKFLLPRAILNDNSDRELVLLLYRRFMRLKGFVSQRQMIQTTYVNYVKYKFKYEDYDKKRSLVMKEPPMLTHDWKVQAFRTYNLIALAISHVENNTIEQKQDIVVAKQILKNILTMEYFKVERNEKEGNTDYHDHRIAFTQLTGENTHPKNAKLATIAEFEKVLIMLNETLGIRL